MTNAKKAKPPFFTSEDCSLPTVNGWIFSIKSYVRGEESEEEKVEIAASYLSGVAKIWFVGKYALLDVLPPFAEFIDMFKAQFSGADDARQLRVSLERIHQGSRCILEYSAEFQMIHAQIGPTADPIWVHHRFVEGLQDDV